MPTQQRGPRPVSGRSRTKDQGCESAAYSQGLEAWKQALKRPASAASSTSARSSRSVVQCSRSTGPTRSSTRTSVSSTLDLFPRSTCSAEDSPARISPSATPETNEPLRDLACKALALACGLTWRESLALRGQHSSWSKTWRTASGGGAPPSFGSWSTKATKRFASHWNAALSAATTDARGNSSSGLLPTPTASAYGSTNNGCPGDGREVYATGGTPSLHSRALATGGVLTPTYLERVMGFNEDHTMPLD